MIKNISLCFLSLVIALGITEIILRRYPTQYVYFQTRNIIQQTQSVPSGNLLIGYEPKPNSEAIFSNLEFKTSIKINSQGMRNQEYSEAKPEGVFRILTAGDSFVFGWGVEDHETASTILERNLPGQIEVLNLGVSGYSSDQILERLKVLGLKFNPDIVLYFSNGLPSLSAPDYAFRHGRMYYAESLKFSRAEKIHFWLMRNVYTYCFADQLLGTLRHRMHSFGRTSPIQEWAIEAESAGLLAPLQAMAKSQSFIPIIIYIPGKEDFLNRPERVRAEVSLLESHCLALGVHFFDLTPYLKKNNPGIYFTVDDHWTSKGHRVAAEAIAGFLKDRGLLPEAHEI